MIREGPWVMCIHVTERFPPYVRMYVCTYVGYASLQSLHCSFALETDKVRAQINKFVRHSTNCAPSSIVMHGSGCSPWAEYDWRPEWAENAGSLPSGQLDGASCNVLQSLRSAVRSRDDEACKRSLDQLPRSTENVHHHLQEQDRRARWEIITPQYFRVAHEAVCGDEGAFTGLDISALDMVRFLHINGAPMDAQDTDGRTPL
mmetsp:Transcript_22055/g.32017  ORF Transcript_22055/g.32017 Transcript_22055/m.32017 type:complete len:203 (-) Transcript_22055:395-1003(-)